MGPGRNDRAPPWFRDFQTVAAAGAAAISQLPNSPDPEVAAARHHFWTTRFDQSAVIIHRAIARGDLPPGTDPHDVIETLYATPK